MTDNSTDAARPTVHAEARGPHWIAWITTGNDPKPWRSVVVVGSSREDAEERARRWVAEAKRQGYA